MSKDVSKTPKVKLSKDGVYFELVSERGFEVNGHKKLPSLPHHPPPTPTKGT